MYVYIALSLVEERFQTDSEASSSPENSSASGRRWVCIFSTSLGRPPPIHVGSPILKCISSNVLSPASRRRAPARLRQPEPRMRLAVRGVPKGALCTHST